MNDAMSEALASFTLSAGKIALLAETDPAAAEAHVTRIREAQESANRTINAVRDGALGRRLKRVFEVA